MATENFAITALPHSCGADAAFHVSLFVSPRLVPDGGEQPLRDFEHFPRWGALLADEGTTIELSDQSGVIEARPLLDAVDPAAWEAAFGPDTPVRGQSIPEWENRRWRSFRLAAVHDAAKLSHLLAMFLSPTTLPSPRLHPWARLVAGGRFDGNRQGDAARTRALDEILGESAPRLDNLPLAEIEQRVAGEEDAFDRLVLDLHRARRYYERPESELEYAERPADPPVARPLLPRPVPDFHERCTLAGDHGPLLRRLGLVVDLEVADPGRLRSSRWLSARILPGGDDRPGLATRVRCEAHGDALVTVAGTPDWSQGRLRLGDPERFRVLDLDADGSALKLERFLWTLPGLVRSEANGDPAHAAPPAQRSPGFTIAKTGRALGTQDRLSRQRALQQAIELRRPPLLNTEDVTRGYRVEVWDDTAERWASLHARRVDVDTGGGRILEDVSEEGWIQGTAAHETPGVEDSPVHVHEAAFGWEGWSLSAPKPGRRVRHDPGAPAPETGRVDAGEVVEDPDPGAVDDPATAIVVRTRVEPGSLPRLRYGRSYAFRAWAVDLAGNSRPHTTGPAGDPSPDLVAAVAATLPAVAAGTPAAVGLTLSGRAQLVSVFDAADADMPASPAVEVDGGRLRVEGIELDPALVARMMVRRGDLAGAAVGSVAGRAALVERAMADVVRAGEGPLVADVASRDAGALARIVASEGVSVAALLELEGHPVVTPLRPFLRWEPVLPPAIVARRRATAGESLRRVVIRSGVVQDLDTLVISVTPPDDYAAAADPLHGYRGTSERHLAPPKTSQPQAELHAAFDPAMGSTDPAEHARALAAALRESGTWFDVDVPRLDDPMLRDPQPGIALEHDPGVTAGEVVALPLPLGDAPPPGQYVVHDTDQVVLPYLPDVVARGLSFVFPEAGVDRMLPFPLATEGFTVRYDGDWPAMAPYRMVLGGADALGGRVEGGVVRFELPPGDVQRLRLASSLDRGDLPLFGQWRSLPPALRANEDLAEAAADGWLWGFTPAEEVVLVHAVPRPLEAPRATSLYAIRLPGSVEAILVGGVDVHGPSTMSLTAEASWEEPVDDLTLERPEVRGNRAVAFTTPVLPYEDLAIVGGVDAEVTVPGVGRVRLHRAVHRFTDTRHRRVHYRFRATTRFREYFDPAELAAAPVDPDAGVHTPADDGRSVVGPETVLSVRSTAPPAAPLVHSVIPLFRWDAATEPEQPVALRRRRRAGLRIYLERPWFSSGEDELLGVLIKPLAGQDTPQSWVSQWGRDPVWESAPVAQRALALELADLLRYSGLDDRPSDAGPVAPPATLPLPLAGGEMVTVLGYRPQFNEERGLWYADVAIDPGDAFWPFVRLAVARYQPESIPGCHLSKPVRCDFAQLTPERTTSVSRTDDRHVRVVVSGPVGTRVRRGRVPMPEAAAIAQNRTVVARLQRRDPQIPTDLGWLTVDAAVLPVRGKGRTTWEAAWVGSLTAPEPIPLIRPGDDLEWRVTVEEWERLPGDPADLGQGGAPVWERRLIYADEIAL